MKQLAISQIPDPPRIPICCRDCGNVIDWRPVLEFTEEASESSAWYCEDCRTTACKSCYTLSYKTGEHSCLGCLYAEPPFRGHLDPTHPLTTTTPWYETPVWNQVLGAVLLIAAGFGAYCLYWLAYFFGY